VPYTTVEGREQVLNAVAVAAEQLGLAVGSLTAAYEELDEAMGDRLERELFRPVQSAYGRAKRTHSEFATRHELSQRSFAAPTTGAPARGVKGLIERAVQEVETADATLAELQDSMLPVEVGDAELRAGLGEVRTLLDHTRAHARELLRTFGR
jgi:hypothetical protein